MANAPVAKLTPNERKLLTRARQKIERIRKSACSTRGLTREEAVLAALLNITDLDDMLEELDPEFQNSLGVAHKEYQAGKALSLHAYLKERLKRHRARLFRGNSRLG